MIRRHAARMFEGRPLLRAQACRLRRRGPASVGYGLSSPVRPHPYTNLGQPRRADAREP